MKKLLLIILGILPFTVFCQTVIFNPSGTGANGTIQQYVVPNCVSELEIQALGAQGGNTNGGLGAGMAGTFNVIFGDTIFIVVGQQGTVNFCGGVNASSGGGGGSFVWKNSGASRTLLLVAGGGGGGNMNWSGSCIDGIGAVTSNDGTQGSGPTSALGGTAGNGGFGDAPSGTGSGGAGWLTDGQNSTYGTGCTGGLTYPFFTGGSGSTTFGAPGEGSGGFGGGGGAVCGNGGGGGYSGGGGGEGSSCRAGGGGGGSYNIGTDQINVAAVNTGNGLVTINPLTGGVLSASFSPNDTVCAGTMVTASASNGSSYTWNNGITNAVPFPANNSLTYQLTAVDTNGCADTVNLFLQVNQLPTIGYTISPNDTVCSGTIVTLTGIGGNSWNNSVVDNTPFSIFSSNTYIVTGTDTNNCVNYDTVNVVVNSNPTASLGADIIQANPPANLNAGAGFSSYLWSTTETTQIISVNTNGIYDVTITDANGCSDSDTIQVFFTAGTNDLNIFVANVNIYPNPSNGVFSLNISNITTEELTIDVMDMKGVILLSENLGAINNQLVTLLDLTNLSAGNYILRLNANGKTGWASLIKQ